MSNEKRGPVQLPEWLLEHLHLYRTDPERAHLWDAAPVGRPGLVRTLLLSTTGRRSLQLRQLPLLYEAVEGKFIVIASRGGSRTDPEWYLNLQANPRCEIQVGLQHHHAHACTASGPEREALWQRMLSVWPPYATYQSRTSREIPVVVLEPQT